MVPKLKYMSFEKRVVLLKLPSLAYRRQKGDIIEICKYTHMIYQTTATPYNLYEDTSRRNNSFKIIKERCTHPHSHRRQLFGNYVNNIWNVLPPDIAQAPSTNSFISRLDIHWKKHFVIINVRAIQHNRTSVMYGSAGCK